MRCSSPVAPFVVWASRQPVRSTGSAEPSADQHPVVAGVSGARPGFGGGARRAGGAGRRRRVYGVGRALARRGRGARFLLGMVVSTGVGGGLVLNGAPYPGRTGNAGHVGHVVVDQAGARCACGGRGCVETVASGPSMVRWARDNGWSAPRGAGAKELAEAAVAGNALALAAFRRGATALAAMIASVGAVCDLDLVVVGGEWPNRGACCSTRCARHWPTMRGWISWPGCGWCRPSSAVRPGWSARPAGGAG
ncbi:ROK family protein [Mycobacterium kansasii]|uniref:ROK family protein n=1 Tax=Mycobacterium kansasii TaxID=1768 RepID=A0A1V3WFG1_MYCKA|nr:ROK family protein [Mycobacterium kansasii]